MTTVADSCYRCGSDDEARSWISFGQRHSICRDCSRAQGLRDLAIHLLHVLKHEAADMADDPTYLTRLK